MTDKQVEWTDEKVAELRQLAEFLTAGQIATKWGVTRNVICGKMARLKLNRTGVLKRKAPRYVAAASAPRIERRGPLAPTRMKPPPPAPSLMSLQAPEPVHGGPAESVDIWGLAGNSCRWPLWLDSEPISQKLYCGGAVVEGLPYCETHCRVCYPTWTAQ